MRQKKYYIILGIIGFFIVGILAFDVYVLKFGKFWEKKPSPQVILPTPSSELQPWVSNPLVQKAKEIGYNIIWMDPKDTVGRTVFYEERKKSDYNFRGIGIIYTQVASPSAGRVISYLAGSFQSFESIPDSPDEYVYLTDPQMNSLLPKTRLIFSQNSSQKTYYLTENLSFGPNNPYDFKKEVSATPTVLSEESKVNFKNQFKTGDAVILSVISKTNEDKLINAQDPNGQLIANLVVVRQFK